MSSSAGTVRARAVGIVILVMAAVAPAFAAPPYRGRSVQEVLRELGDQGLRVVYNTDLVPERLLVTVEPAAGAPVDVAAEILGAHGLVLQEVGRGAYAVTRGAPEAATPQGAGTGAQPAALAEIVVTTSRYGLAYEVPQPHMFLTQADVQALPRLADEPLRAVQRLPGTAASGISAQSHIRGGEFEETRLVLDGLPLDEPFHLKNFLTPVTLFDAQAIGSIDVYSGGFTAEYGGALSGIVDIRTREPPEDRYTELGLSLFHSSALSAGRFGEGGEWLASVRRSNLDLIAELADSDVGKPEYFDAFGRASIELGDDTTLFASALTSRDEIEANTSDRSERTDATYRNTYVWAGWQQRWRPRWSSRLILALTDVDNDREGSVDEPGQRQGSLVDRRTLRTGVGRLDLEHRGDRAFTRFGIEGREVEARYRYSSTLTYAPGFPLPDSPGGTVVRDLSPEPDGHQSAAYATTRVRLTDRLVAEAGLRWDHETYDDLESSEEFAPRLNVMYDLSPATRLRAGWGRFWQAQGPNELQVEDGVDTFYEPQRADHLILGVDQVLPWSLDLRVETWRKDYDRVRPHFENLFDPVRLLPEFEPDRVLVAPARSDARGVELLLSRRAEDPWSWWLGYGWSRVTDRIDGRDVPRSWDQRHTLSSGLRYAGQRWEFTVTDSYHSGWPTTELLLLPDPAGGPATVAPGPRNDERYRSYNRLDLRVLRRFELPASTLEAFFEVTNALVQRNPCCTEYEVTVVDGAPVIDSDLDYWPTIIPSLGVLWKF